MTCQRCEVELTTDDTGAATDSRYLSSHGYDAKGRLKDLKRANLCLSCMTAIWEVITHTPTEVPNV